MTDLIETLIFILSIWGLSYATLSYVMRGSEEDNNIEENIKKHETRTGGLHSDYKYGEANKKKNERK
tara:strand:- start:1072 stop:1272 length:201 start_codon:yes stop_codon:yes gene_type:complete